MEEEARVEIQQASYSNHQSDHGIMMLTKCLLDLKDKDRNVVFSPLSIQLILALIAAGSEGQALEQLLSFFNVQTIDQLNSWASHIIHTLFNPTCLSLANGVWIDKSLSFNPFFKKAVVKDVYKGESNVLDFKNRPGEAVDILNTWVEKKTNGLIKNMVPPNGFNPETRIVLANAIYFKASWVDEFEVSATRNFDFHLLDNNHVRVPFMTSGDDYQYVSAFDKFKVLKLRYIDDYDHKYYSQTAMYIFLPDAKDGLQTLVDKLGSEPGFLERHIPHKAKPIGKFRIPKFKISFGFEASDTLKELGLHAPFIPGGGLDKMVVESNDQWLYVSDILHKSTIEVKESGTEASAASLADELDGACRGPPPKRIDFVADHPFLFIIREDKTGVVLFIGRVLNPLAT